MWQILINKSRIVLYFIVIGIWAYIWNRLRLGKKAEQQLIITNYDLQKEVIKNEVNNEDLSKLVDDTNKHYRK